MDLVMVNFGTQPDVINLRCPFILAMIEHKAGQSKKEIVNDLRYGDKYDCTYCRRKLMSRSSPISERSKRKDSTSRCGPKISTGISLVSMVSWELRTSEFFNGRLFPPFPTL